MRDEILTYREMCDREGIQTLQRGMNYRLNRNYSVVLMSRRSNAPYEDRILEDGQTIEYEGHDITRPVRGTNPKQIDQSRFLPTGTPTQNGLFADAVDDYRHGEKPAELVRVYEKLFPGVWSDKGFFSLLEYKFISDGRRNVFKFYLKATGAGPGEPKRTGLLTGQRLIPSEIKKEVWKRDKGSCVLCGANDNLHFDHDIPWSKGGSSITADNVKILCARHNLEKRDKIQ